MPGDADSRARVARYATLTGQTVVTLGRGAGAASGHGEPLGQFVGRGVGLRGSAAFDRQRRGEAHGEFAEIFTFADIADGIVKIRDFQTTGVVAFAKGTPLYALKPGKRDVMGQRIVVNAPYQLDCEIAMDGLVRKL
jgi:hypothetical protein